MSQDRTDRFALMRDGFEQSTGKTLRAYVVRSLRTMIKRAVMWLYCRRLLSMRITTWLFKVFNLKAA